MSKVELPVVTTGRVCGPCTACCHAVGVVELNKDIWTFCKHQRQGYEDPSTPGCKVHDQSWSDDHLYGMPPTCEKYQCAWLKGIIEGDERRRPDKLGIILDENAVQHRSLGKCLSGWELWDGALNDPKVEYLLNKLGNKYTIFVRKFLSDGTEMRIFGRPEILRQIESVDVKGLP